MGGIYATHTIRRFGNTWLACEAPLRRVERPRTMSCVGISGTQVDCIWEKHNVPLAWPSFTVEQGVLAVVTDHITCQDHVSIPACRQDLLVAQPAET